MNNLKHIHLKLTLIIFISIALACCNDSGPEFSPDFGDVGCLGCTKQSSLSEVVAIATRGTWRITYYWNRDHEETASFNGYNFTFGADNILTATNGVNSYTGNWNVTNNTNSTDYLRFNFAFTSPPVFQELPDNWNFGILYGSEMQFTYQIESENKTSYITFTKNI
ncbi:MAG TPA: hypothetical protein VFS71_11915 [Flavobacterium sp.]|uniref:hypothetical protein n=1 Tax=Flavobacterium sp. TaxID=239 RepID=UPI002DB584F3|nr:hypothetical protein [Flavobacterium sp.]HEU4790385.1 hypothetical protein [Flavobacterium sp.]